MTEPNEIELKDTSRLTMVFKEGDIIKHPAGTVYKRINGNWVLQVPTS